MQVPFPARFVFSHFVLLPVLTLLAIPAVFGQRIYWSDATADRIQRARLDNPETIQDLASTGAQNAPGLDIDERNGLVYWVDVSDSAVRRVIKSGGTPEEFFSQDVGFPPGIAVDPVTDDVYFSDLANDTITRLSSDGSQVDIVISTALDTPFALAIDPAGGKLYWSDLGLSEIRRANLDGSNPETFVSSDIGSPTGMTVDSENGFLYWADANLGQINRAALDGSARSTVISGQNNPFDVAIDTARGKIYWSESVEGVISRANTDGSQIEDFLTGLSEPLGIALELVPEVLSITAEDANPTSASLVSYLVTFSEDIEGVDLSDFMLLSDLPGASIDSLTSLSPRQYRLQISTGPGTGEITLSVVDDDTILSPFDGQPLGDLGEGNGDFIGETYLIDRSAPRLRSIAAPGPNPTSSPAVDFLVQFDEPVTGLTTSNLQLSPNVADATILSLFPLTSGASGTAWILRAGNFQNEGDVGLSLVSQAGIADLAGNLFTSIVPITGDSYTIRFDLMNPAPGGIVSADQGSSLTLWLKADAGTSLDASNNIVTWFDQSGNANHLAQATAERRPRIQTFQLNNRPALRFDDGETLNRTLPLENLFQAGEGTLFFVVKPDVRALWTEFDAISMGYVPSGTRFSWGEAPDGELNDNAFLLGAYHLVTGIKNPTTQQLSIDGSERTGQANDILLATGENRSFILGTTEPENESWRGNIAEVILLDRGIHSAERTIIENYLSARYGLSIANDRYQGDTVANGRFDLDVTGIGRETDGVVSSARSRGLLLRASAFPSQADEYLLAGHRDPAIGTTTAETPAGIENRWSRIWFLDVTSTAPLAGVDLLFDFSEAGFSETPSGDYTLLRRTGTSGAFQPLATTNRIEGDRVVFSIPNLPASGYYTLGKGLPTGHPEHWVLF